MTSETEKTSHTPITSTSYQHEEYIPGTAFGGQSPELRERIASGEVVPGTQKSNGEKDTPSVVRTHRFELEGLGTE
jgi:hypothetical protein